MSKNIKNILQGQMTEASGTKSPGGQEATPIKREASNPPTAKSSNTPSPRRICRGYFEMGAVYAPKRNAMIRDKTKRAVFFDHTYRFWVNSIFQKIKPSREQTNADILNSIARPS